MIPSAALKRVYKAECNESRGWIELYSDNGFEQQELIQCVVPDMGQGKDVRFLFKALADELNKVEDVGHTQALQDLGRKNAQENTGYRLEIDRGQELGSEPLIDARVFTARDTSTLVEFKVYRDALTLIRQGMPGALHQMQVRKLGQALATPSCGGGGGGGG